MKTLHKSLATRMNWGYDFRGGGASDQQSVRNGIGLFMREAFFITIKILDRP